MLLSYMKVMRFRSRCILVLDFDSTTLTLAMLIVNLDNADVPIDSQ
jgi:hypothetical protein